MKKVLIGILIGLIVGVGSMFIYNEFFIKKDNATRTDKKEVTKKEETKEEVKVNDNLLSEEAALEKGNELWKYAFDTSWGNTFKRVSELSEFITNYEEVKSHFTDDFYGVIEVYDDLYENSVSEINQGFDEFFIISKNSDGTISRVDGRGRGSAQDYLNTELSIKTNTENEIIFKATSNYCNGSIFDETSECASKKISATKEKEFIIKKVDNEWKIKYFYLPN